MASRRASIDLRTLGRVCIAPGIHYVHEGDNASWERSRRWQPAPSNKALCGRMVGTRKLDGASVAVVRVRNRLYATSPFAVKTKRGPLAR